MTQTIVLMLALFVVQSAPKAGPWKSLFDGKSLDAWRIFKTDNAPKMCDSPGAKDCWEIVNGALQKDGQASRSIGAFSLHRRIGARRPVGVRPILTLDRLLQTWHS